jgi:hypothetical protein
MRSMTVALPRTLIPKAWELLSRRTILFGTAWTLIILSASYDAYFAWQYRAVLDAWEMNPLMLWLAGVGGLASVFLFKLFAMTLSTALAIFCHHRRHRLEIPFTVVIGGAYFALSFHYLLSHLLS